MTWTDLKANWADGDDFTAAAQNAVAAAINKLVDGFVTAYVATQESTTSTTYADLATTTDQITFTPGQSGLVLVFLSATMGNNANNQVYVSFALSGGNTLAASDANSINITQQTSGNWNVGSMIPLTGLSPVATTAKLKYRTSASTAQFTNRRISALVFP